jgi:hypothetical protein
MGCDYICAIIHWIRSNASILIAVFAFLFGVWQYRKSQVWKRLEFVSSEMRTFFDDDAAKAAMTMLDWRRKKTALFKHRGEGDMERITVDYEMVVKSLGTDPAMAYDKNESAIREIFERFLEFLARFEGFITSGGVERNDFTPYLDYWAKLLAGRDERSPEVTRMVLPQLWRFIDYYGYRDVRRFVGRYHNVAFPREQE